MNELMVVIGGSQWAYFRTKQTAADKAFSEFCEQCDNIGLNIDNVTVTKAVLRNESGDDIDEVDFHVKA